ncbi:hypothetical protein ColTof4_12571 [Colletotrichum tofieldiae]|nr:hypothetical protein ColTof4_12571 [Colletotrichum tofieldiae]
MSEGRGGKRGPDSLTGGANGTYVKDVGGEKSGVFGVPEAQSTTRGRDTQSAQRQRGKASQLTVTELVLGDGSFAAEW